MSKSEATYLMYSTHSGEEHHNLTFEQLEEAIQHEIEEGVDPESLIIGREIKFEIKMGITLEIEDE